jgi:hypothetical protein
MSEIRYEIEKAINRLPLILTILALFLLMALETFQSYRDRATLQTERAGQEAKLQSAMKMRQEMDALAGRTATLAAEGDEAARSVVDLMNQQGVSLTPPPPPQ